MTSNKNDVRTVISMWVWISYMLITSYYILSFGLINGVYSKLIYTGSSFLTLAYCASCVSRGFKHFVHKGFVVMCIYSITINLLILIMYYLFNIEDYKLKITTFIGIEIITASFVFISGNHRGLFKNGKSMQ